MNSLHIGFASCEDKNCCFVVSRRAFPWVVSSMEETLLRRCAVEKGSTTIICEDAKIRHQIAKLVKRILNEQLESEERITERKLVLKGRYGNEPTNSSHNIDVAETNLFAAQGGTYTILFQSGAVRVTSNNGNAVYTESHFTPVLRETPLLESEFEVCRMAGGCGWLVKAGENLILINPEAIKQTRNNRPDKIIITSARLDTVCNLLAYSREAIGVVRLVTTREVYTELIARIKCLVMDLKDSILEQLFPLEEILAGEFQCLTGSTKLRVGYAVAILPTLTVQIYYQNRSVQLFEHWYYYPKQFYLAWKEKKIEERRYYQIVNPQLKHTLCLLDTAMVNQGSLDELSRLPNVQLYDSCSTPEQRHRVINSVFKQEINWAAKMRVVSEVLLFQGLFSIEEFSSLVEDSETEAFKAGQLLVRKGMRTQKVFVVCSGAVLKQYSANHTQRIERSDLLYWETLESGSTVAEYSAYCSTDVTVLAVRRELCSFLIRPQTLHKLNVMMSSTQHPNISSLVEAGQGSFGHIQNDLVKAMLADCQLVQVKEAEAISGAIRGAFALLLEGSMSRLFNGQERNLYRPGEWVVSCEKVSDLLPTTILKAKTACQLLLIDNKWFHRLLKIHYGDILKAILNAVYQG